MSDKNKPEITATIKFRGVTIEGMTIEELRQLRDVLNQLVGEKERVIERHEYVPYYPRPFWAVSSTTVASDKITLGGYARDRNFIPRGTLTGTTGDSPHDTANHYVISCNN